jgi:DNA repair exonuclease SbcCD ATPase subunit
MDEINEIFNRGLTAIKEQIKQEKERLQLIDNEIERLKSLKSSREQCLRIIQELEHTLYAYEPAEHIDKGYGA